jgi:hypothetical protein
MENPQEKCVGPWKYLWSIYHKQSNKLSNMLGQTEVLFSRACSVLKNGNMVPDDFLSF